MLKINKQKIVLQEDTWGPLMPSNPLVIFGKELLEEDPDYLYKYKGNVPILAGIKCATAS